MKEKAKRNNKFWVFTLLILAVIVMFACLGVGATYAYFASKLDKEIGAVNIGTLKLDGIKQSDDAEFTLPDTKIVPNQHIANVSLKAQVKSDIAYYTRVLVGAIVIPLEGSVHSAKNEADCADYVLDDVQILEIKLGDSISEEGEIQGDNFKPTDDTNLNGELVYYKLTPSTAPESLDTTKDETFALSIKLKDFVGDDFCEYYMGATIKINVSVEVIQADFLESADKGNNFENVSDMNTTWEKISPRKISYNVTFEEASWALIDKIAKTGRADEVFNIGDTKTFKMTDGNDVTMMILGFNHDELSDDPGKTAGITLGMKNLYATNDYYMTDDSWDQCTMRTDTLAKLFYQIPEDLQSVIKEVNKKSTEGNKSTKIITTKDKLWLLSVAEIFPELAMRFSTAVYIKDDVDALIQEGTQYEYFTNLFIKNPTTLTNSGLIKYEKNGNGYHKPWWLRSPTFVDNYKKFFLVDNSGACVANDSSFHQYCLSFCFCI